MSRNAHIDPLLAEILNAITPAVPEPILVRETCYQCNGIGNCTGDPEILCNVCAGVGYILTERTA